MSKPACHDCGSTDSVKLRRIVNKSGATMIAWRCIECDTWTPSPAQWIKHDAVKAIIGARYTIDDIPIYEDYRTPCAICGTLGAQYHHWFPQMFKDHPEVAPDWQHWDSFGVELCQYHHDLWHDLVTPDMPGRGNSRQASKQLSTEAQYA